MFWNITSIFNKLMLKSVGYGIIKYINKFLGIIGIDLHFFTYKVIIAIIILCSIILIGKFGSLLHNIIIKNDLKTEKTGKTIRTDYNNPINKFKSSTKSSTKSNINMIPHTKKHIELSKSSKSYISNNLSKSLKWTNSSSNIQ